LKAIIFNSGLGNRMGEFTKNNHKSMAILKNGETIFHRQLRILSECGIRDFVITTGPFKEQLAQVCSSNEFAHLNFTFVNNPIYDKTNYIYSMYLAREHFNDDALLLHGDLVFDKKLIQDVLNSSDTSLAMVNQSKQLPEKDFKARVIADSIREVSIHIFDSNCYAFQPLYKLSKDKLVAWTHQVEKFIEAGNDKVYAENALNEILWELGIKSFSYEQYYIDEVDNQDDLERVSEDIRQFDFDQQLIFDGSGDFINIPCILAENNAKRPMLVCDSVFDKLFISEYFNNLSVDFVRFSGFSPNPLYEEVAAGAELFNNEKCDFIIAVGGGSAIDTAKNIKLFSALDKHKNYLEQEFVYSPVKIIAIPTTAGTGSESTRFSVLYYNNEKQSISHDTIVPEYVFLEPKFLETLPEYQKKSTMLDAMCQCIEAIWSVNTNDICRNYAQKGLQLIVDNVLAYLRGDRASFKNIMMAANLSGKAINISQTTAAHAMSYKVTSMYGIAHGHAVGLCLPSVWRFMLENMDKTAEGITDGHIRSALTIFKKAFNVKTKKDINVLEEFEFILELLDLEVPLLKDESDIEILTDSVNPVRLGNNPVVLSRDDIMALYREIFGLNDSEDADQSSKKSKIKDKEELRELQQLELEILLVVDEFCKKHNITYYLGEGTLLGAMRHGGFIPWDDDVDILMPREDYDRFIKLAQKDFPVGYNLDSFETNPKHWVLGAKIQITRKTKFTQEKMRDVAMYNGPYIDIFPLDYCPKRYSKSQKTQMRTVRLLRRILFIKSGYSMVMKRKPHRYAMRLLSKFIKTKTLFKWVNRQMRKFNNGPKKYMVNLCSYYPLSKEVFPTSFFGKMRFVPFEGHMLPVPSEAEYMLKTIYGKNYMKLPPKKVRKGRAHNFSIDEYFQTGNTTIPLNAPETGVKVSVIVPVYNVEEYLAKCLDSLVNQTQQGIEVIVVNDGSLDNSQEIIDRYRQEYPHIIKSYIKENSGAADTRNFGISKATGDYIAFVDSDDYVSYDMYEKMLKKAYQTRSDIVVCRYYRFKSANKQRYVPEVINKNAFGYSVKEEPDIILGCRPYLWNKIFRRSLIVENEFKIPSLKLCEDSAFVYPLLLMANKVDLVDEPFYNYQEDRTTSAINTYDDRFYDVFQAFDIIINYYKEKNCFKVCYNALAEQCRIVVFVRLGALNRISDRRFALKFIKTAYKYLNKNFKDWRKNPYYKRKNNKKIRINSLIYRHRLFLSLYHTLPFYLRNSQNGSSMKKRISYMAKQSKIGQAAVWLLSKSNRQAREFTHYYENGSIRDNYIFYAAFRGDDFSGNPYAIFKHLYSHPDMKDVRHVILVEDKENPRILSLLDDKRITIVHPSDYKNYAKYAETSKYLVVDTSLSPYYIKRKEQIYVHTWHSTLLKTLGAHTDFIWETHNMAKSLLDSDFFVSPNRFTTERLFKAYYCDTLYKGKVLELGYPRNDLLIHANKSEVRKSLNIPDGKKLVLYAPTWRGTVTRPVKDLDIFIKHYQRIKSSLGDEYVVLIKFHHMSEKHLTPDQMKYVVPFDIETNMLLSATDILITDYSGIFFDYLITGNPLILFPFDQAEYLAHRGGQEDFYLDLNEIPAPICRTSDEIIDTIHNIDAIAGEKQVYYEAFAKRFVGNDDGHASERVCDIVFHGKKAMSTYSFPKQDKQGILIIMDDLNDMRITTKMLDFLDNVDYEKYNVSVWLNSIHSNRKVQLKINHQVKLFYKSVRFMYLNFGELKSVKKLLKNGFTTDIEKLREFSRRNINRNFADRSFDIAVYYTGKSELYSMLCLQGVDASKKVAYWHGEKPLSTFKFYDEIVKTVAKELPLDEMGGKTISRDDFESRFTSSS